MTLCDTTDAHEARNQAAALSAGNAHGKDPTTAAPRQGYGEGADELGRKEVLRPPDIARFSSPEKHRRARALLYFLLAPDKVE